MRKCLIYSYMVLLSTACVETFEINDAIASTQLSDELIIEATLTNELKQHRILLSRPTDFAIVNEPDSIYEPVYPVRVQPPTIDFEQNATVAVNDDQGNSYRFLESSPGTYVSEVAFQAQEGVDYVLDITTDDGTNYLSTSESYSGEAQIDSIYAIRELNDVGIEGVSIYVDGSSNDPEANYYRYTYDETYKIIAPEWRPEDFVLSNYDPCALPTITYDLEIIVRENEYGKVCYRTDPSTSIIQNNTMGLGENRTVRFPVRFLDRSNFIISHRYSILVRQYVQSQNAFNYYNALESFASTESVFSTAQPGFIEGNISVQDGSDKKTIGFFEVAAVTEKRLYFNYADLFPNEPLPDYAIACVPWSPPLEHPSYCIQDEIANPCPLSLVESLNINLVSYFDFNIEELGVCPGPYLITFRACGDCTIFGSPEVPEFWIE